MAGRAWGHPKGTALEACRKQGCGQGSPVRGEQSQGPGPHRTCADSLLSATLGSSLSSTSALQRLDSRSESRERGGQPPLTRYLCPRAHQPPHVHALFHAFIHSCISPVVHSSLTHSSAHSVSPLFIHHSPLTPVTPHSLMHLQSCTHAFSSHSLPHTQSFTEPSPARASLSMFRMPQSPLS